MSNQVAISTNDRVSATNLIIAEGGLDKITRFSAMLASSNLTPVAWQGKPVDCGLITMKALSLGFNPLDFIQGVYSVKGNVSYKSSMLIAMIHNSGLVEPRTFTQQIGDWSKFEFRRGSKFHGNEKGLGIKVGFKFKGESEVTWGSTLWLESQTTRNSSLWESDVETQLTYVAARRWSAIHTPGITMGMTAKEEMEDYSDEPQTVSLKSDKVINLDERQVSQEVNFDIEENIDAEEVTEVTEPVKQEPKKEVKQASVEAIKQVENPVDKEPKQEVKQPEEPQEGDLDINGLAFDSKFMTGSKLVSGAWRLNKAGKEHFAKLEAEQLAVQEEAKPESKPEVSKVIIGKVVDQEAANELELNLGDTVEITSVDDSNPEEIYVSIKGIDGDFPANEGDIVYIEIEGLTTPKAESIEESSQVSTAVLEQVATLKEKFDNTVLTVRSNWDSLSKEAQAKCLKEKKSTEAVIKITEELGEEATEVQLKNLDTVINMFISVCNKSIESIEDEEEQEDNPF